MSCPPEVSTLLLTGTATVYGRAASGQFTTVLRSDLACRLLHLNTDTAPSGGARSELAARRVFCWDAAYAFPALPAQVQLEVGGLRWNPVNTNAIVTRRWTDGSDCFKATDVIRAAA